MLSCWNETKACKKSEKKKKDTRHQHIIIRTEKEHNNNEKTARQKAGKKIFSKKSFLLSPGAPPAPVRLSGQKIFEEKFSPFQWTGRWKLATNGGSWQHFYTHLNALKIARIERREDSKTLTVAEIGKNGYFFCEALRGKTSRLSFRWKRNDTSNSSSYYEYL